MRSTLRYTATAFVADRRALTMGFVQLLGALAIGAVMIWMINKGVDPIINDAGNATAPGSSGAEMNAYLTDYKLLMPGMFIVVSFFGFIVNAVYERGLI